MKIAVGSTNPTKLNAVRTVVEQVWPAAELLPVAVPTGVSAMPMSDAECIAGARNRAKEARELTGATFGVGLEGGASGPGRVDVTRLGGCRS